MTRSIVILYGSETGNSQDLAYLLARKCERLRFQTVVCSLDDFDLKKLLDIKILIIICSTTGQGELPRNARSFWKFMLRKKLPLDLLEHLYFTTFGLGDSSYPQFNYAAKKIHRRLLQLGAIEISNRAESDEQAPDGIEGFYMEWEKVLISNLNQKFPLPENLKEIPISELLPARNSLTIHTTKFKKLIDTKDSLNRSDNTLITGQILHNERMTSDDHFQDVRNVLIKSNSDLQLHYKPGDTVALYPSNDPRDVQTLLDSQGWDNIADFPLSIQGDLPKVEGGLLQKLTLRSLITYHLDIVSIPKRSFFLNAWYFASDEREREKLLEFSKIEGTQELYDYANRPRRSILETILEFFSLKIPVDYILEIFPILKPRLFSISSKPNDSTVELTVAIVEYKTMLRKIRRGICTRWLKKLKAGDNLVFHIREQNLQIGKPSVNVPLIMIAPGTGIAPIKSLIETKIQTNPNIELYLFTGNRYHDKDFLYGELWNSLLHEGKLTKLFSSFSREGKGGYVQEILYKEKALLNDLISNRNAIIYLCGSSGKMPNQVRITFTTIFEECNEDVDNEKANQMLLEMENQGRYIQETW
ncbi:hypothetical protein PACTADRAFT_77785 [Pachysolen tannophilus NRRL Y-2460]|uniref:NADPH-dependent diflavin oxidoreductase 1 n=1 Tax=Pachysolen tannophilus NRRL Y-2460 TaxID=669874 RepID=A0A1E4TNY0_PACTA|nr:hypothetical protein PACTADRAFT_77785 [Pachysolen tannophilus NRRL Y-2460]